MYINNNEELLSFVSRAKDSDILCIDTEFLREKTYYAKLCLVQIATRNEIAIIDPFSVRDISPLAALFADEHVIKVFHACHQDVEILYRETGLIPNPIFDTQIAATLLGETQQVGLAALVNRVCGVQLKKSDSFTDWSRRPLTESQIDYAADDVRYLPETYDKLKSELIASNRFDWLMKEFRDLSIPEHYVEQPENRYLKLKRSSHLSRRQLAAARELCSWRETTAQERDIPRKWVLTDEQIVEICKKEARALNDLFAIRGVKEKLNTSDARLVANLIDKAFRLPEEELPLPEERHRNEPNVDVQVDVMTAIARIRAHENNIALQTMAPHDSLEALARGHKENNILMKTWRKAMIGDELCRFLDGQLIIYQSHNGLCIKEKDSIDSV